MFIVIIILFFVLLALTLFPVFELLYTTSKTNEKAEENTTLDAKSKHQENDIKIKNEKLINAKSCVDNVKELSDSVDFKENDKTIASCVIKLYDIIISLNKDTTKYNNVANLFEVYVPEFYNQLKLYADLQQANALTQKEISLFTDSVTKFYQFLFIIKVY